MSTHAEQYAKLPLQDQEKYEGRAQVMQTKRQFGNNDLIAEARQKAARLHKRVAESKGCPFRGFVRASCKLSDTDLEEFATIVNLSEFTVVRVGELRKLAMEAPPPPTLLQQARLASISLVRPVPVQKQPWLSTLCLHRDIFSQTALVWNTPAGSRYFAFIFAMKSPYLTCMRELVLAKKQVFVPQCVSRSSWESIDDSVQHGYNFIFADQQYHYSDAYFPVQSEDPSFVLRELSFSGETVRSAAEMIPWSLFLECLPPPPKTQAKDIKVHDEFPGFSEMTQKHPWLLNLVSDFGGDGKTIEAVKQVVQKLQQKTEPLRCRQAAAGTSRG